MTSAVGETSMVKKCQRLEVLESYWEILFLGVDASKAETADRGRSWKLFTHRPQSSSFLGFPYRILNMNPKKELLWGLWVDLRASGHRFPLRSAVFLFGAIVRLMDKILHDPEDPKLWELWYIPYNG